MKYLLRIPTTCVITFQLLNLVVFPTNVNAQEKGLPICPLGSEYVLVEKFSDEFNGKHLDTAKFWDFNPTFHGRKPAYFARENVKVRKGMLELEAREQKPSQVSVENQVRGYDKYTTATIKSKQRIRYGYFETRAKAMKASVSGAFWLYDPLDGPAKYSAGDFSEEIDIFEIFGKPAKKENDSIFFATVHRMETPYVEAIVKSKQPPMVNKSFKTKVAFDFTEDYHVYGLLWTPTEMIWYIDGKEIFKRGNDFFKRPLHLMLDCEIMQAWAGLPVAGDLPGSFSVDYVRVWQLKE
jgi:beta-glucanase (GH16 family)